MCKGVKYIEKKIITVVDLGCYHFRFGKYKYHDLNITCLGYGFCCKRVLSNLQKIDLKVIVYYIVKQNNKC